ncbi:MAG: hypothetical protein K2X81_13400, partial [Candidatus Obscuribacterales bacterium]|nr:hypothetical protein [Candidatus Obscuribacterales bacterium]
LLESVYGKAASAVGGASERAAQNLETRASKDILGAFELTDRGIFAKSAGPSKDEIVNANRALVSHIDGLMPQVQEGRLDWVLGGSSATNMLAGARSISILDASKLPQIVPQKAMELNDAAVSAYRQFARQAGDVDLFVVKGGQNRFLSSAFVNSMEVEVPAAAHPALKAVGEYRQVPLIQPVKMEFEHLEIAAVKSGDQTFYVTGPGQLMGNKFRQVLRSFAPQDAQKLTGDFSHLMDAASSLYTEKEMLQFGRQAIQRNNLIYEGELLAPWEKTAENEKFVSFLRQVLESEEKNGKYLQGLNVESKDSLSALRLFEGHAAADKEALAGFINKHGDFIKSLDVRGSGERTVYLQQGGKGKASEAFMRMLQNLKPSTSAESGAGIKTQLEQLDQRLSSTRDLPSLDPAKAAFTKK